MVLNQAKGRATEIITSSPFALTFPASKPVVTVTKSESFLANVNLQGVTLVEFKIENKDPAKAIYRITTSDLGFTANTSGINSQIDFERGYQRAADGVPVSGRLALQTDAISTVISNGMIVEVAPNSTAVIKLGVASSLDCANRTPTPIAIGGMAPAPRVCQDWISCNIVWHLNFHVRSEVKVARIIDQSSKTGSSKVRDELSVFSPDDVAMTSSAEAEMAARQLPLIPERAVAPYIAANAAAIIRSIHWCN